MRKKLTQAFVSKAPKPTSDRVFYWDTEVRGLGLMVTENGHRAFVFQYRAGKHRSRRMKIGTIDLDEARRQARKLAGQVADHRDPLGERRKREAEAQNTLQAITLEYFHRQGDKLRTRAWQLAAAHRLIFPKLGTMQIADLRRSEIVRLLDSIKDERGPVMADKIFQILSRVLNWHAGRDDEFKSPIVKGMWELSSPARDRILTDDELRAVWNAAKSFTGPFGPLVRFLLLTGARRSEAAEMTWDEVVDGDWTLPAARNKTKIELTRPLSGAAMSVLLAIPRIGPNVFTTTGRKPLRGFGIIKTQFDKACGVKGWRIHDLRRTARSLMSRAAVPVDHAERCLGHVLPGVRGIYDRHQYADEIRRAYEALAAQIERINQSARCGSINPQDNVVEITRIPA